MQFIVAVSAIAAVFASGVVAQQPYSGQQCVISVPSPYDSAQVYPIVCTQTCGQLVANRATVTKVDKGSFTCSGVPYYSIRFYDRNGRLGYGFVPGAYLNCNAPPPPAALASSDPMGVNVALSNPAPEPTPGTPDQASGDVVTESTTADSLPQINTGMRRSADDDEVVTAQLGQMTQCKVPKTTAIYSLSTCEPLVKINAGSVVVDQGRDIVYSSQCDQTYVYVQYMLMSGYSGYGMIPYSDIEC